MAGMLNGQTENINCDWRAKGCGRQSEGHKAQMAMMAQRQKQKG